MFKLATNVSLLLLLATLALWVASHRRIIGWEEKDLFTPNGDLDTKSSIASGDDMNIAQWDLDLFPGRLSFWKPQLQPAPTSSPTDIVDSTGLTMYWNVPESSDWKYVQRDYLSSESDIHTDGGWFHAGFGYSHGRASLHTAQWHEFFAWPNTDFDILRVVVPFWFVAAVFSILPGIRMALWFWRGRSKQNHPGPIVSG